MTNYAFKHTIELKDVYGAIARGDDVLQYFPRDLENELSGREDIVIAEIAGRDSIAAALSLIKSGEVMDILPISDDVPPQYGNLDVPLGPVFWLREEAEKYGVRVHDLAFIRDYELYNILTAKYSKEIIKSYGFYTPCTSCHLYFHTIRAPLVRALGGTKIICGERDSHDGRIKPSQFPLALDYYKEAVRALGGELLLPIREIDDTNEIKSVAFKEDKQRSCMFKQSNIGVIERIMDDETGVGRFFEEFALPLTIKLIDTMTREEDANITKIANEFVRCLVESTQHLNNTTKSNTI